MEDQYRQEDQIQPGPCPVDSQTGIPICPPPTEIDIIKVKKIFNECMHTQVEEITIDFPASTLEPVTEMAQEAECISVEVLNSNCIILNGDDIVRLTFTLEVTSRVPLDSGGFQQESATLTVQKTFSLDRASDDGIDVQCHVFPSCLFCFISSRNELGNVSEVTCCVGVLILLKAEAEVQLLIPTYGYPAQPPECGEFLGECPTDFSPDWPPYPPQLLFSQSTATRARRTKK
ncbi:MAG: hypothetical protein ACOWWO_13505 [Peptococcaceae bacterium]